MNAAPLLADGERVGVKGLIEMRRVLMAGRIAIAVITAMLVPSIGSAARGPTPTPTLPPNLLTNGGFEEAFGRQWNAANNAWVNGQVAAGWTAWWRKPTAPDGKYPGVCAEDVICQAWHEPEYRETKGIPYTPPRIRSGDNSQMYFTSLGLHEGGLYQRVRGVPVGWSVRFSIWARTWSASDTKNMFQSSSQPSMHVRVGIDPNGGIDPWDANIVWSQETDSSDAFSLLSVDATTRSGTVTVFFRTMPDRALKHIDVMVDDAELIPLGPPPPTPVIIDAPNKVANAATPGGSAQTVIHVIQPGDTLFAIAQVYRVDLAAIYSANGLNETSVLRVGQSIVIPLPGATPAPTAVPTPAPVPVARGMLCVGAFDDASGDGRYDEDENGLSGVAFLVVDRSGATVAGSDVRRCFDDLPTGAYSVVAQVPAGYIATTDTSWGVALTDKARVDVIVGGRRSVETASETGNAPGGLPVAIGAGSVIIFVAAVVFLRRRSRRSLDADLRG